MKVRPYMTYRKLYPFVYKDTVKESMQFVDALDKEILHRTSEHQPEGDTPTEYFIDEKDNKNSYCHIYSENEVPDLELVMENVEFGLPMAAHSSIIFEDDFDSGETVGQPPTNWTNDGANPWSTFLVSNAQYNSSPNSLHLADTVSTGYCRYDYATGEGTGEKFYWANKIITGARFYYYAISSAIGNYNSGTLLALVNYRSDGNIWVLGSVNYDTGVAYAVGAWRDNIIIPYYGTETFDFWYNGVKIATGKDFYTSGSSTKAFHFGNTTSGGNTDQYVDDFRWGDAPSGWSGKYLGVENPAKLNGVAKENVNKVNGVGYA